ncbi:MAG: hypothetical protein DMF78_25835 [Acidobacteria bacterium]|nr:MAG: hypothetical protein DMF78_25835 [Acidobacteriota bacterium]
MWSWHCAQASVVPSHTVAVVLTRSTSVSQRASSTSMPPSWLRSVLRWKPVAMRWSGPASASISPAICSIVNWRNGMSASKAAMTQSRHFQAVRRRSFS